MFDKEECRVYFKNKLVLVGGRDIATGLWQLPIDQSKSGILTYNGIRVMKTGPITIQNILMENTTKK